MRFIWRILLSIWGRLNRQQRLYAFVAVISVSLGLAFLVFDLGQNTQITISSVVSPEGIGGACGPIIYDSTGKLQGITFRGTANFDAPAPIYWLDPSIISPFAKPSSSQPCPTLPEVITPTIAMRGQPLYPLYFNVSSPDQWITSGESFQLDTTIGITNSFSAEGLFYAIPFTPTEKIDVQLHLNTTTFDFAPSNEQVFAQELSVSSSPHQTWVLSPKADVVGKQTVFISLKDDKNRLGLQQALVSLEVRPLTGVRPGIGAIITAIGTFLIGIFGVAKLFLEVQELYAKRRIVNQSKATAQNSAKKRKSR